MLLLATLGGLLAIADGWFTIRAMKKFGLSVELNPSVRWFAEHFGIVRGVILGCVAPGLAIPLLAILLGGNLGMILLTLQVLLRGIAIRAHLALP